MDTKNLEVAFKSTQLISNSSNNPAEKKGRNSEIQTETESRHIVASYSRMIKSRFPEMTSLFSQLPDSRKPQGRQYSMEEIMTGGLSLFPFREGSRNRLNNNRRNGHFGDHYRILFGMKLPHRDTVREVLCELTPPWAGTGLHGYDEPGLFDRKCLRKYHLSGEYYTVAADATGVVSFDGRHCEHCLTRKSKTGKITCFHYVLQAKLVTKDGHAPSPASEWMENYGCSEDFL